MSEWWCRPAAEGSRPQVLYAPAPQAVSLKPKEQGAEQHGGGCSRLYGGWKYMSRNIFGKLVAVAVLGELSGWGMGWENFHCLLNFALCA